MTDFPLPQMPRDSRQLVRGFDTDDLGAVKAIFGQVQGQEIDWGVLFGGKTGSTTYNDMAVGYRTFTLNYDDGKIVRDSKVEMTNLDDTVCWMVGIVTAKDTTAKPAKITVFVKRVSPTISGCANWEIQITDDAAVNVSLLGYSSDSKQFGASNDIFVGATVSVTTDASKLFNSGSHIVFEALLDGTQYFRGISQAYNASTGALSVFVTDVSSTSGTYTAWALSAQDGPAANAALTATSTTSITIATGMSDFVTQSGKGFVGDGFMFAFDATNSANFIFGVVNNYSGTALRLRGIQTGGSGTIANWSLISIIGPLGNAGNGQGVAAAFNHDQLQLYNTAQDHTLVLSNASTGSSIINLDGQSGTRTVTLKGNPTLGTTDFSAETASTLMGRGSASGSGATQEIQIGSGLSMAGATLSVASPSLAVFDVTVTPAQISGNLSSVASNVATWSTSHGLTTGQQTSPIGGVWSGVTIGQAYYVNVPSATTFTFHNTLDDAKAGTSIVALAAGSGTRTLRSYTCSIARNTGLIGLDTACPVSFNPGTTTMEPVLSLASAPSVVPAPNIFGITGLADATGVPSPGRYNINLPVLSNSNKTITYSGAVIVTLRGTPAISALTTLANQANNAFRLVGTIN